MIAYLVEKTGKVANVDVIKGQTIIPVGGKNIDIKEGEKYLAVSVFIPEEIVQLAVESKILVKLPE